MGTIQYPVGTEMGTIGANQETSKKRQECIETQQKEDVLKVSDGVGRATESINKWTILDSNRIQNRSGNELFSSTGYYSGDYPELEGTDELLSIWAELDETARRDLLALARSWTDKQVAQ